MSILRPYGAIRTLPLSFKNHKSVRHHSIGLTDSVNLGQSRLFGQPVADEGVFGKPCLKTIIFALLCGDTGGIEITPLSFNAVTHH